MIIEAKTPEEAKEALKRFFNTDLPAIGADTERNIFKSSYQIAWPMPPQPMRDGQFIRWRAYLSPVSWSDLLIEALTQAGGYRRVIEAVISCRIQDQVDQLDCQLREATEELPAEERKGETGCGDAL